MKYAEIRLPVILPALLAAALGWSCSKEAEVQTRHFRMGFVSQHPAGISYPLPAEADIVNHDLSGAVPWQSALLGESFAPAIMEEWTSRKHNTPPSFETVVTVTPLNAAYNGLAIDDSEDGGALSSPWRTYPFNHPQVKTAYLNYCRRVIDFFQPDYFAMATEANLLYLVKPDLWNKYLELHEYIYHQLKVDYPGLPVFTTVSGGPLLKGFSPQHDFVQHRLALMQVLASSDCYALSCYPDFSNDQGAPFSENSFDELFSLSGKPLAIAAAGYTPPHVLAGETMPPAGQTMLQKKFLDVLLRACERHEARFVVYTPHGDALPAVTGDRVSLAMSGLYDADGVGRPALNSWKDYFARKISVK